MSTKPPITRYVARVSYVYPADKTVCAYELCDDQHGIMEMEIGFVDADEWDRTGVKPVAYHTAAASLQGAFETSGEARLLLDRQLESMRRFPGLYSNIQGWVAKVDIRRNLESNRNYHMKLVKELNLQLGEG